MELVVPILVLFIGISFIWFLITGIIVIFTGRDISIGDLPTYLAKRKAFENSRDEYHSMQICFQ